MDDQALYPAVDFSCSQQPSPAASSLRDGEKRRKIRLANAVLSAVIVLCILVVVCACVGVILLKLYPELWEWLGYGCQDKDRTPEESHSCETPISTLHSSYVTPTPPVSAATNYPHPLSPSSTQLPNDHIFQADSGDELNRPRISSDFSVLSDDLDLDLSQYVEDIWNADRSRFKEDELILHLQNKTNTSSALDMAPDRLLALASGSLLLNRSATYEAFISLLADHLYTMDTRREDGWTDAKLAAVERFYQSYLGTDIARITRQYLERKRLLTRKDFKALLYQVWFEPYARSPKYAQTDSSGFEHVFRGEFRGTKIIGFHSWIQFYVQEQNARVNYYGYLGTVSIPSRQTPLVLRLKFLWDRHRKRLGSFFVGTSPEFDFSLYTVCFLTYPNRKCEFILDNQRISIQTWDIEHVEDLQIGTAYPD